MTVATTDRKQSFDTNGVTVDFPFTFKATDAGQIFCQYTPDGGESIDYTNFTVVLQEAGGTVTTNDILDDGELLVFRVVPLTQNLDYVPGGRFPAESHEAALDKLTLISQDQQEEIGRALKGPINKENPYTLAEVLVEDELLTMQSNEVKSSGATVAELNNAIDNANNAAANAGILIVGEYVDGTLIENFGEGVVLTSDDTYWRPANPEDLPFTINATAYPNPENHVPPLKLYADINTESLPTYTDLVFDSVADAKTYSFSGGEIFTTKAYKTIVPLKPLGGGMYFVVDAATYGAVPDGNIDFYVSGGTAFVAVLIHDNYIDAEQAGITPTLSDTTTRTNNNTIINSVLDVTDFKTIRFNESSYYFHKGIVMQSDVRAKALIGAEGNTPAFFYFDQVTTRNIPETRRSTLATNGSFLPENEPDENNTAICYGSKTQQVGRVQMKNIRPVNDSAADTFTNKLSRVGTGIFLNSGFSQIDRIVTEGWHVGSYEIAFVTNRGMIEHIAFNIGFVLAGGTSSTLSGYFANGTNYDRNTSQFIVTYTAAEEDEFQGFGFLFNNLYYSNFNSLSADKIQRGYGIFGNTADYRTSYEFIGCGCEFVENDYVIEDPSATVDIHGGQDWGRPDVQDANKVNVYNRRFPAIINSDLSSGVVTVDGQTYELQNPIELVDVPLSAFESKGYNGLVYQRVKVDQFFKYWRIKGRLEVNEFEMRKNIPVTGALTGELKFYGLDMTDLTEFNGAMGKTQVNTIRFSATNLRQAIIDPSLSGVTATDGGPGNNYFVIAKQALADPTNKFVVEVDLELKTSFSGDFTKTSTRPDDVTFKGIDY